MNYDVDYFIEKFKAIPEENWCIERFTNGTKHCALGHCGTTMNQDGSYERRELQILLKCKVVPINDGYHTEYRQKTPKQRILAALNDVKNGRLP